MVNVARKSFTVAGTTKDVLVGLTFNIWRGEFLTVLGPSGCGKTTLLRIVAGLDTEFDGSVSHNGQPVSGPSRDRALLFQEPRLFPWLRVAGNISFALPAGTSKNNGAGRLANVLELVGLTDYAHAWPMQLSGGMAKRVAIARALMNGPSLLLMDEPFSGLDLPTKHRLQEQVSQIQMSRNNSSCVLVTHDLEEALYFSDRILVLSPTAGHLLETVPVDLGRPRQRASSDFVNAAAALSATVSKAWATK